MDKELNEDARTKQDLQYECSILESRLSNEIIKNENLEQQCKQQKEVIDKLNFIKKRKNQGASQENINKMAIKFVNSYLKEME